MKLHYYSDTDTLAIDLSSGVSARTREIAHGVTVDLDSNGNLIGVDIENASKVADLTRLVVEAFPTTNLTIK